MNKASVILAVLVSMLLSFSYLPFFEDPSAVAKQIALVFIAIIGLALGAKRLPKSNGWSFLNYKKSFLYLVGTQLDFSGGLNGKGFQFINPNAERTCGCGESFAV